MAKTTFDKLQKPPPQNDEKGWYRWYYRVTELLNGAVDYVFRHDQLTDVLQASDTSGDATGGKHVTDAQLKQYKDHSLDLNNPHGTTFTQVGAEQADPAIQQHLAITDGNPHGTNWDQLEDTATHIPFNLAPAGAPYPEGSLWWSDDDATLNLSMPGGNVSGALLQEMYVPRRCKNETGADMDNGTIVYINGVSGNTPTITLADCATEVASTKTIGMTTEGIGNGGKGYVTTFGIVREVNTIAYTVGTILWLANTGGYTDARPSAPNHAVFVGYVLRQHATEGEIFSNIQNGYELSELHDVDLTGAAEGNLLVKQTDGVWRDSPVFADTQDPTGWVDNANIVVTYDSTARTITLTGALDYYWRGIKKTLASPWTSPAHGATTGLAYFLSTTDGANFTWSNGIWTFDVAMVAFVSYGATSKYAIREVHGLMPWQSHQDAHLTHGTYKSAGGTLGAVVTGSTTAANRRPTVSAATLHDEDIITINPALAAGTYTQVTLTGTGTTAFTTGAGDIVPLLGNNPYYNAFATPNWIQTPMANASYMCVWCVAIPVTADAGSQAYRYVWIQGQTNGTLASQQALNPQDLNLGQLTTLAAEFNFIAKVIIQYVGANWNVNSVIALTGNRSVTVGAPSGAYLATVSTDSTLTGDGTVGNPLSVAETMIYALQYDDVGGNIAYFGEAAPGTATSAAVWRIRHLDFNSSDLVVTWADGNSNFDNVWDNRLSLTYS